MELEIFIVLYMAAILIIGTIISTIKERKKK